MRTIRDVKLDTRSARARIGAAKVTHWITLSSGCAIGYRKGVRGGAWVARFIAADRTRQEKKLGTSDDVLEADGVLALSYKQAEAKARAWFQIAVSKANGESVRSGRFTVADALKDYISHCKRRGLKAVERMEHATRVHILPSLGTIEVDKLTRGRLERWHENLASSPARLRSRAGTEQRFKPAAQTEEEKRARKSSANRVLAILKAALNYSITQGNVTTDSAWRWVKPFRSVCGVRVRFLTIEEQQGVVTVCSPDFRLLVQAALYSGCRYGELCRLRVEDFQHQSASLFIPISKNGKSRHVHLTAEAVSFFNSVATGRKPEDRLLMRDRNNGFPAIEWRKSEQHRKMKEACKRAQIEPRLSFHELRHTYASTLIMAGVPLVVVAKQLGHADTRMVEIHYGHLAPNYVADTIRAAAPKLGIYSPTPTANRPERLMRVQ
jgi:integrase